MAEGKPAGVRALHVVQFYRHDGALADRILGFVRSGLARGDGAVVIATDAHVEALRAAAASVKYDLRRAVDEGRLLIRDASTVLSRFMQDGTPDRAAFRSVVGELIDRAASASSTGRVCAYGEMVDVLWRQGNPDGVLRLEELWQEILEDRPIELLCAYGLDSFDGTENSSFFREICDRHSQVALADLEERAHALETLFELSRTVDRAGSIDELFDSALKAICDLIKADRAAVQVPDASSVMRVCARHGGEPKENEQTSIFGLSHQGKMLGELVIYSQPGRVFSERERHLASTIAGQITQAIVRMKLLEAERSARAEAEQLALRSSRLHSITASLSTASTVAEVAEVTVLQVGAAIGASTGGLWLVDDGRAVAEFTRSFGHPEQNGDEVPGIPLDGTVDSPLVEAMLTKKPQWYEGGAALPLIVEGRCIGVLGFTFDQPHPFPQPARQFKVVLARHCALAIQRARSFDAERRARADAEGAQARSSFLLEASIILSSSLDYEENFARLKTLAESRMCDRCTIDAWSEPKNEPQTPRLIRDPGGERTELIVPMVARGKVFGTMRFETSSRERLYGQHDLELADLLGRRAGIAIDNALLYRSAQQAAEAREEVLAVVSHDLRNPLGVIFTSAMTLLRLELADKSAPRVHKIAEAIQRSAERMSRLIGDLIDFAGMRAGHFKIERKPCSPEELVNSTAEMFLPMASDRELTLDTKIEALDFVPCDRDRIIQALGNLVSNAVKVTAAGGRVTVGASNGGGKLTLYVEDTGPGLASENLPKLFERYYRGDNTNYKGTGLGLTIAKGIVEAHGGRIWAESTPGVGSKFSFSIPSATD